MRKIVTTIFLLSSSLQLHAICSSVKAAGWAGAGIARPVDSIMPHYNPAGAAWLCNRFDWGVLYNYVDYELRVANSSGAPLVDGTFEPKPHHRCCGDGGFSYHLPCNFTLAISRINAIDHMINYKEPLPYFAGTDDTDARCDWRVEAWTVNLAYRFCGCHALGVGVNFYGGHFKINGLQAWADSSVNPSAVSDRGHDYTGGVGVTVGYSGQIFDCFWLGLSYSPRVRMRALDRYEGLLANNRLDLPTRWRIGALYTIGCRTALVADFEYRHWKDVHSLAQPFYEDGADISDGSAPLLGSFDGPGFGWRNSWVVYVGVEHFIRSCLALRAGYRYRRSPVRGGGSAGVLNVYMMDLVQNYYAAGLTWYLPCCWELSGYVEYGQERTVDMQYPAVERLVTGVSPTADISLRSSLWGCGVSIAIPL